MGTNDRPGFWGPPTASIDWCEDNYVYSYYIAEFFNSFSSFAMIILGEAACYSINQLQTSMDRNLVQTPSSPPTSSPFLLHKRTSLFRFKLAFRTITVVGIGSFLFHATLLHKMQMLDELPMLYSVLVLFFCLIESRMGPQPAWFPKVLILLGVIVTGLVALTEGAVQFYSFHGTFGPLEVMTLFLIFRVYQARKKEYSDVKKVFEWGIGLYALAVGAWMTDLNFCETPLWPGFLAGKVGGGVHQHEHHDGHQQSAAASVWIVKDLFLHAWWHTLVSLGLFMLSTVIMLDGLIVQGWTPRIEMKAGGWLPVVRIVGLSAKAKEE